jgi:hypothetical protein
MTVTSASISLSVQNYITSVVLGSDMISRLSFFSLSKLREEVLDCIVRARVNKARVLQSIFRKGDSIDLNTYLYPPGKMK